MRHRTAHLHRHCDRQRRRRGVAMLLVLIGVITSTILATAYLASRDNSVAISRNVQDAIKGRWAAVSALERGIAILQATPQWRDMAGGQLLFEHEMADMSVDLQITDLTTGGYPDVNTQYVLITATATPVGGGLSQTVTATAFVPLQADDFGAAVDLSEFAVFTLNTTTMKGDAILRRWPAAPLTSLGRRLAIGTLASNSGQVSIIDNAVAIDTTLYHKPGASSTLLTNNSSVNVATHELPGSPVVAAPPGPGVPDPDVDSGFYNSRTFNSESETFNTDQRFSVINMNQSTLTIDGSVTIVSEDDLNMTDSNIIVTGDATIVVFDDLIMNNSTISIDTGATLRLFIAENFQLINGAIGDNPSSPDPTGGEAYQDPTRVQVHQLDYFDSSMTWNIGPNAVLKGSIYAPWSRMVVKTDGALYGRVLAKQLVVQMNGAIYYDHRLDMQAGYINETSAIYDENFVIRTAVSGLASLDDGVLLALATTLDVQIYANGEAYGAPGSSSPDPFSVKYTIQSFGSDVRQWEVQTVAVVGLDPLSQ